MEIPPLLARLVSRRHLTGGEARDLFDAIMDGHVPSASLAAVLAALATKGETVAEIVGAAEAMRARVSPVHLPAGAAAIDTCGTGGDGQPIFNISTTAAIVAAAAGAVVAKHGNRSHVRPSGSAEVLAALGVNIEAEVPVVERCLAECRIAFLYAVRLHPAMKHAAPVRRELGVRTIFNLLGPLTNPAGVRRQLIGVNRPELVATLVEALQALGAERALVVHGLEGLSDLSIAGPSRVGRWDGRAVRFEEIDGRVVGAPPGDLAALRVTSPEHSARIVRGVLDGAPGPAREIVVFNAAAALWVAGLAEDWTDGAGRARAAIDSGAARQTLAAWVARSQTKS